MALRPERYRDAILHAEISIAGSVVMIGDPDDMERRGKAALDR